VIIIGIDPGLAHTGWGVIRHEQDGFKAIAYGVIDTSARQDLPTRLATIHEGIREVIERYDVGYGALEDVFAGTNVRTAFLLGQARGCALLACARLSGAIGEYAPNTIKQHIVGYGLADKEQVAYMVGMLLGLDHVPTPDHCSDALAIALTHGFALLRHAQAELGRVS